MAVAIVPKKKIELSLLTAMLLAQARERLKLKRNKSKRPILKRNKSKRGK